MPDDHEGPDLEQAGGPDISPDSQKSIIQQEEERLRRKAEAQAAAEQGPRTEMLTDPLLVPTPTKSAIPFGAETIEPVVYKGLPARLRSDSPQQHPARWRIELHGLSRESGAVGLDILGDVVLGRGLSGEYGPDLDLEPFGAFEQGVSRRHAMLRPSRNSLYLIDLNSTNGTWHNALRVSAGITRALANNDSITLGRLTFTIRIVDESDTLRHFNYPTGQETPAPNSQLPHSDTISKPTPLPSSMPPVQDDPPELKSE